MNSDVEDKDHGIKTMNAMNAVQLFVAVWTFTTVCQAEDDGCSVSCDNVTGSAGKEVTFTCRVSQKRTECCIVMYKFQYPESYKDSTICKEVFPEVSCDQRNSFTCRYTPTTAMTEPFRFFLQTWCGMKTTELHVNITDTIKPEILTEVITPEKTVIFPEEHARDVSETSEEKNAEGRGFEIAVITAVVSSLIIIIVPIIYRITQKHPKRKRTLLVFRHDGDNCNHAENVI